MRALKTRIPRNDGCGVEDDVEDDGADASDAWVEGFEASRTCYEATLYGYLE